MVGSIGLGAPVHHPVAAIASLAVADFDGDGHSDVLSQDRDGFTVCLLRGVGDGSLLRPECQQLADSSTVIAALPVPFGRAMFLRAKSEVARWTLGSGGRFALIDKSPLPANASAQGLAVADVDGDGRLDVLVTTTGPQPVSVLRLDGANWSATPVVGCAQLTIGRPPAGAGPVGAKIMPDTAMSSLLKPCEWYSTSHAWLPAGAPANGCDRMMVPGCPAGRGLGGW